MIQVIRTRKLNWETGNHFLFNFPHSKIFSLLAGRRVIPAGLPFSLYLQGVVQLDEIQLDKRFRATAGDAGMSRRFLCLLLGSFNFSLGNLYHNCFGFHLLCSCGHGLSKHPRAAVSLVHRQERSGRVSGRGAIRIGKIRPQDLHLLLPLNCTEK